jgi:hypothetical protein
VDTYPLRHAVIHIQYQPTQGTFTSTANDHRSPVIAFNVGLIGKKSLTTKLTLGATNSVGTSSFDFDVNLERNDRPGFYKKKNFDRSTTSFNLNDYADLVGGFSQIAVSGSEAASVNITSQINQETNPSFKKNFTLTEMRGSYTKGCGIG